MNKKKIIFVFAVFVLVCSDFLSKRFVIEKHIQHNSKSFYVLPFFNISHVRNSGVAFGIFSKTIKSNVLCFLTFAFSLAIFLNILLRKNVSLIDFIAFAFVSGGAIGNSIDRVLNGSVYDFLDFHFLGLHWPSFNLADIYIFVGIATIVLFSDSKSLLTFGNKL